MNSMKSLLLFFIIFLSTGAQIYAGHFAYILY